MDACDIKEDYKMEYDKVWKKYSQAEIKKAVETVFGVHVLKVRTANMKGGLRYIRGTRRAVTESTWKKAIVTLKDGERIEQA